MIRTRLGNCTYQVSSPYNVFNLVAVANMSEKNTSRFMGGMGVHLPFGVPRKSPSTHLKNEKLHPKTLEINLITMAKNLFCILKNKVRDQKSS